MSNSVDKFSISSLLWRAGWSPSGLLSFRKDPVPSTLLGTLDQDQEITSLMNMSTHDVNSIPKPNNNDDDDHLHQSSPDKTTLPHSKRRSPPNMNNQNSQNTNHFLNYRTDGIPLNIPLSAAVRCGGMLMDNFETGHASLAPIGAYFPSAHSLLQPPPPSSTTTSSTTETADNSNNNNNTSLQRRNSVARMTTAASTNENKDNNHSPPPPVSSAFSPLSPAATFYLKSQLDDEMLLPSRSKIIVGGTGSFDPEYYLHHKVKSSTQASGSWFGGGETLSDVDSLLFTIGTELWNLPPSANNNSINTTMQRKQIATFSVTRLWKEIKRFSVLLHELNPELLLPPFEQLDQITEEDFRRAQLFYQQDGLQNYNNTNPNDASSFVIISSGGGSGDGDDSDLVDVDMRLRMIRELVATIQRNSASSTHSPVIAMFLMEEDHDAFYKFLQTMEQQLKVQTDARSRRLQEALDYQQMKENERMNNNGSSSETKTQKKDKEPGFFASLFGGSQNANTQNKNDSKNSSNIDGKSNQKSGNNNNSSSPTISEEVAKLHKIYASMIPTTPEQLQDADTRTSTCQFLIQDINAEIAEWKEMHESFIALDTSTRRLFAMSRRQLNHVRNYGDSLVEFTNELVGTGGLIKQGSSLDKFLRGSSWSSSSPSSGNDEAGVSATMNEFQKTNSNNNATSSSGFVGSTMYQQQSQNNNIKNNNNDKAAMITTTTMTSSSPSSSSPNEISSPSSDAHTNLLPFSSPKTYKNANDYLYEGQTQVELDTKSNLRMAVMLMGSRADSLQGAEHMLAALCQSSKVCLLTSRGIVAFLQHHRILVERASQLSHLSQQDSERLLDFVIHIVRPIAIEEVLEARRELTNREHLMTVMFYSLSRQLRDGVLRCCNTLRNEESMRQQDQEEELAFTISGGGGANIDSKGSGDLHE